MFYEIEKTIKTYHSTGEFEENGEEKIEEKELQYNIIFTDLSLPFAVSRHTQYGEEVLKEPIVYNLNEDFLSLGNINSDGLNMYFYLFTTEGDSLSNNYIIWKNGQKRYENMSEPFQNKDDVNDENTLPEYGENSQKEIPTHEIENRSVEVIESSIVRTDNTHLRYKKMTLFPFTTDALHFTYNIPDSEIFPGWNNVNEVTQSEYNDVKNDPESIYNNENNVYKVTETGEYYHLSSNKVRIIETPLPSYNTNPNISSVGSYNSVGNDSYNKAYSLFGSGGTYGTGLATPVYNILSYPTWGETSWLNMFRDTQTSAWNRRNNNLSLRKSMRGYYTLGRFLYGSEYLNYPGWINLWDGGYFEKVKTEYLFEGQPNVGAYTSSIQNNYFNIRIIPEYYIGIRRMANMN